MANMGNMVIVEADRVRAIRTHIGGFGSWDNRPSQSEMMALLSELIERRAQAGEWPEEGYVTIQQGEFFNGKDRQSPNDVIDRMASEIHGLKRCVEEWRQRCYRNESADVDAVRLSMQAEINKRDIDIERKNEVIDTLTRDEGAARQNNISAHRRIAELEAGMNEVIANNEMAGKKIAELETSNARKKSYIGKMKAKHAELALQLRIDLDNMTESNRGHVLALKRANMKLNRLAPLLESEISDYFSGIGSPGEPETPEVMQSQLIARIINIMAEE
ncbi:hypothetical protein CHIBITOTORO_00280 [Serratia phage vB_SmaM-ChibiTotoro]|nr:hypothetical protein CHIBITOTORO_00280 [Serratia phage vB_SmaM-ChibiTotoro]